MLNNDPHLDVDHGYNMQYLPAHFMWEDKNGNLGYFGGRKKGVILTFGWVLIVNTFFRTLSLAGICNQLRDVTSLSVAIMALLFGLIGVGLQVYLPYKDLEIGMAESICMLLLAIICYAASLKDFFQGHRMSAIFENERAACDFFIVMPTIAIIIFLFLVVLIGFGEIALRLMRIQRLKRDQ